MCELVTPISSKYRWNFSWSRFARYSELVITSTQYPLIARHPASIAMIVDFPSPVRTWAILPFKTAFEPSRIPNTEITCVL